MRGADVGKFRHYLKNCYRLREGSETVRSTNTNMRQTNLLSNCLLKNIQKIGNVWTNRFSQQSRGIHFINGIPFTELLIHFSLLLFDIRIITAVPL